MNRSYGPTVLGGPSEPAEWKTPDFYIKLRLVTRLECFGVTKPNVAEYWADFQKFGWKKPSTGPFSNPKNDFVDNVEKTKFYMVEYTAPNIAMGEDGSFQAAPKQYKQNTSFSFVRPLDTLFLAYQAWK